MPRYLVFTGDGDALGPRDLAVDEPQVGDTIPAGVGELFRVLDVLAAGELRDRAGLPKLPAFELRTLVVERIVV